MMIVEAPRLRLRELTVDDAEFVFRLVSEPSFLSNIGDKGVRNLDDARQFILEGPWTRQKRHGYGQFLVERKEGGVPIGVCGLIYRESLDVTDVGFAILPEYWKRGFAYEAAEAMVQYGRSTLGIDKIVGLTSEENLASISVLEKLGMKFERIVKMSEDDPGTVLYS
ncbi:MAG: GNAT family N-acetyltransferase [Verrucomicrobia bacterium]|nr:MAG: GNAT family N-acetyltransferase [Verrucomicrobiota bacterium]